MDIHVYVYSELWRLHGFIPVQKLFTNINQHAQANGVDPTQTHPALSWKFPLSFLAQQVPFACGLVISLSDSCVSYGPPYL